jgi:hypothetical protein
MSTTDSELNSFFTASEIDAYDVSSILTKPVPQLPISNSSAFDLVAVVDNKNTVRINWETLTASQPRQVSAAAIDGPGLSDSTPYITFAADDTGLYVSDGTTWRKMATYGENWTDISTTDTRFLPVNSTIEISDEDRANVFNTLKLGLAGDSTAGLVKVSSDASSVVNIDADGVLYVKNATPITTANPDEFSPGVVYIKDYYDGYDENDAAAISSICAVTEKYVYEALSTHTYTVPFASTEVAGIVKIAHDSPLVVSAEGGILDIAYATATRSGVVKLETLPDEVSPVAISFEYLKDYVTRAIEGVKNTVASTTLGLVRVEETSAISITADGAIDVKYATEDRHGAVILTGELTDDAASSTATAVVATQQAVVNYVADKLNTINTTIQPATTTTMGVVQPGIGLTIRAGDPGILDLTNATRSQLGGVYVESATNDTDRFTVPSVTRVHEIVDASKVSINSIPEATYEKPGLVMLSTHTKLDLDEGYPVGVDKNGRLRAMFNLTDSFDSSLIATYDYPGAVQLSSPVIIDGNSTQIGIARDNSGAIYVDADGHKANTNSLGFVRMSRSSDSVKSTDLRIGMDSYGRIFAERPSSSSSGGSSYYIEETGAPGGTVGFIKSYKSGEWQIPYVAPATLNSSGTIMLSTEKTLSSSNPAIGIDSTGRLRVDGAIPGGGSYDNVSDATDTTAGVVKLSVSPDTPITSGLPVGVNEQGQLYVASTSTGISTATTTQLGGVLLSSGSTYTESGGLIGLNSSSQIVVAPATSDSYGAVKVSGNVFSATDSYSLVGTTPDGKLAVAGSASPGGGDPSVITAVAPLSIRLIPLDSDRFRVTMTGGSVQMNDGTIVNVDAITEEHNMVIEPLEGQTLKLKVYINNLGEAVAKLQLVDSIKVVPCSPVLDV